MNRSSIAAQPPLREVIRTAGLAADKRLGQHFLLDPAILARIAAAAAPLEDRTVVEVGPGPGGLTRALLDSAADRVVAIERDLRCTGALQPLVAAAAGRLVLIAGDAREVTPAAAVGDDQRPIVIVANLPYNIATELLIGWLADLARIERMVLMFQREVAARLVARAGTADWGRLGVMVQTCCRAERLFDLPAGAFVPAPKVASSVVRLTPHATQPARSFLEGLANVTRSAFGQRRKMLRAALRTLDPEPLHLLDAAGIAPDRRAETLTLEELHGLVAAWLALRRTSVQPS